MWLPDSRLEMPELLVPGMKPIRPVKIDWSNPVARRLRAVLVPTNLGFVDITANPAGFTPTGTIATGAIMNLGLAMAFNGSTYYTFTASKVVPQLPLSMLFVGEGSTSTTAYNLGGVGNLSANNARAQFDLYSGTPRAIFANTADAAVVATHTTALSDGEPYAIVFAVGADKVAHVWHKGLRVSSSAGTGTEGTYTGMRIGVLPRLSAANPIAKKIAFCALWDTVLPDAYAASLNFDPYQFLIPA